MAKVVLDSGIETQGTIINRLVELLAYADDVDITARTFRVLEEAFSNLMRAANEMGFEINKGKTKYLQSGNPEVALTGRWNC